MIVQTVIATDLITPLGAYLRLRETGSASFLLESVEKGRLGQHSFVGAGSRLVSFEEAETCGAPVVGYLSYDYAAKLEPTVQLPDAGRDLPESRFVVADTLVRFDHGRGMAEVLYGSPDEVTELLAGAMPALPAGQRLGGTNPALPVLGRLRAGGRPREAPHPGRRRVPDRALAAGRAADVGERARPLPLAPPGQPLAVPLPARAGRAGADRLVTRDPREGRRAATPRSTRSPGRLGPATATPSGCWPPRRTARST